MHQKAHAQIEEFASQRARQLELRDGRENYGGEIFCVGHAEGRLSMFVVFTRVDIQVFDHVLNSLTSDA